MSDSIKRYYRKHVEFFSLLEKIKLWPSKNGILHGIKSMVVKGDYAEVTTHCGEQFMVNNSKNSRAARWLRNKWYRGTCDKCKIPAWKIEKYSTTCFTEHYGTDLRSHEQS
jgi:pyrrolysyl-tRNA synthetase-like protein